MKDIKKTAFYDESHYLFLRTCRSSLGQTECLTKRVRKRSNTRSDVDAIESGSAPRSDVFQKGLLMMNRTQTAILHDRHRVDAMAASTKDDGRLVFADLVARLAASTPGLEAAQLLDGGPFMYGRWIASLTYEPEHAPDCALLHMDMGPLPTHHCLSVAHALLEANHDSCMQRRGFSLSPLTGHVIYSEALPLETLDIDGLLVALERNAQRAIAVIAAN